MGKNKSDIEPVRRTTVEFSREQVKQSLAELAAEETGRSTEKVAVLPSATPVEPAVRDRPYLIVLAGGTVGEMLILDGDRVRVLGCNPNCDIHFDVDGVSRRHARITTQSGVCVIEDLGSTNGTWVNFEEVRKPRALVEGDLVQLGGATVLKFGLQDIIAENYQRRLHEASLRDGLTQIYNKRYFLERLDAEFAFIQRHPSPLSLTLFDIDHFKSVNDTWGHVTGDEVLRQLAAAINETIRAEDVLARYGGEEFVVLSRQLNLDGALQLAERLRQIVENLPLILPGVPEPLSVTISAGVAEVDDPLVRPVDLIADADRALYVAKRLGRNRVEVYRSTREHLSH